jgi:hypothetical protein
MNPKEFRSSLGQAEPPTGFSVPLAALWWDAKGDWTRSHALVDELETADGMAVHAYPPQRRSGLQCRLLVPARWAQVLPSHTRGRVAGVGRSVALRQCIEIADASSLDLRYIDRWSIWLDCKRLLKTIPALLSGRGAR